MKEFKVGERIIFYQSGFRATGNISVIHDNKKRFNVLFDEQHRHLIDNFDYGLVHMRQCRKIKRIEFPEPTEIIKISSYKDIQSQLEVLIKLLEKRFYDINVALWDIWKKVRD